MPEKLLNDIMTFSTFDRKNDAYYNLHFILASIFFLNDFVLVELGQKMYLEPNVCQVKHEVDMMLNW